MPPKIRTLLTALFFLFACAIFYQGKERIANIIQDVRPDLLPTVLQNPITSSPEIDNLLRNRAQCTTDFPNLYHAITTSITHYKNPQTQALSYSDLENAFKPDQQTWVVIRNNQLYIRSRHHGFQSRVQAVLADLHRAIITSPERLPDIEFLFDTRDSIPSEPYTPVFGLSRGLSERGFLIPDFGYWAWPEPYVNGYTTVQNAITHLQETLPWSRKTPQLFWRGAVQNVPERHQLVAISEQYNETWGNVRNIDWSHLGTDDRYDMADHCRFQYLAHIEGIRYSARLKYLQNCESVIVTHEQKWTTHLSHLLEKDGGSQNVVIVGEDFEDVDAVMKDLMGNPRRSERIARNSREVFGERYGGLGAEVCYWRELIRGYHMVMSEDFRRNASRGWEEGLKDYESVMLMGSTEWEIA